MNSRVSILAGILAVFGLLYAVFFTEWIRPAPIEIASQVRVSILQPHFGRTMKVAPHTNGSPAEGDGVVRKNVTVTTNLARRVRLPDWGMIEQAPGGAANVTFSLDNAYALTAIRVQDVPMDGSSPKVLWHLAGKSTPTRSLLYGRDPSGMTPVNAGAKAEPLTPGVPYRLVIEAGRRRGTNDFTTRPSAVE